MFKTKRRDAYLRAFRNKPNFNFIKSGKKSDSSYSVLFYIRDILIKFVVLLLKYFIILIYMDLKKANLPWLMILELELNAILVSYSFYYL